MALTPSNMLELGTKAPDFLLPDVRTFENIRLGEVRGEKGTLIIFMCNHCPYVIHVMKEMVALANEYLGRGIGVVAISSNDVLNYPADSPDAMAKLAEEEGFDFPYLYDESQEVAKAYDAACTPDFYVFDAEDVLVYRGRMDGSRPGNDEPVTGADLKKSLDAVINGDAQAETQYPSMGCNIKWKK